MANDRQKQFFFITGVHRSGTSAMAQLLNVMGVELGRDLLEARPGINESGFWEHARVIDINERIFQRLGSSWYDFRPLPEQWFQLACLADLRDEADQWLQEEFRDASLAGIKDPRLCRLLPFWLSRVRALGWLPLTVVMYRRPESVALSLEQRDGFSPYLNKMLWLAYSFDAERNTRPVQTAYIDYDYLLDSPRRTAANLRRYFSQVVFRNGTDESIDAVLRKELRHHVTPVHDDAVQDEMDLVARQVMDNLAEPRTPEVLARIDHLAESFSDYVGRAIALGDCITDVMRRFVGVSQKLSSLGLMYAHAQQVVSHRDAQISVQTEELKKFRQYVADLELRCKDQASDLEKMREKMRIQEDARARVQSSALPMRSAGSTGDLADHEKRLEDAQVMLARRTEETRALMARIQDMGGQIAALEAERKAAQQAVLLADARVEAAESGFSEIRQIVASQHELIQDARRYRESTEANLLGMAERLSESEQRNRALQDRLAALDAECVNLRESVSRHRHLLSAEQARIRDHEVQEKFFTHQFAQLTAEVVAANEALLACEQRLAVSEQALNLHGQELAMARRVIADRDRQLTQLNEKYFYTRTRLFVRLMVRLGIYKVPHE